MDALLITKLVLILFIVVTMLYDLIQMRIPNVVCLALALLFAMTFVFNKFPIDILDHLMAMGIVFVAGIVLFSFRILGGGDVKLLTVLALWTGLKLLPVFITIVSLVGGGQVLIILILRRYTHAFEYLLAKYNVTAAMPNWLRRGGEIPYGVAIGIALFIVMDQLPLFLS
ncbi:prepilin peptidase [Kiloniella laminariae]|uniref:Prepilin peptidase n=1 Tax=Kiloniella laminariae TaxID=454162 RepID=A0ABT4LM05_9PROT|nr:prepilin peptidase [Kiloniella laminariae]MCZ4282133.1 prepilin peptidase [Kiloniella laminariae]